MAVHQSECSRLKYRTVMKYSEAEKGNPSEIYRKIHIVFREAYFCQNIIALSAGAVE